QLVAGHFRHDHVADDKCRFAALCGFQRKPPIHRGRNLVALLLEDVPQPLGLGCAVLGNQDMQRSARWDGGVHGSISPANESLPPIRAIRAPAILSAAKTWLAAPSSIAAPGMPCT